MNINWKKIIGWVLATAVVVGVVAFNIHQQQKEEKSDKPIVKIGVTLPLTGSMARLGQQAKKAMELRVSEVTKNSKFDYKLIFEDDQLQSSKEFTNAQKLINFSNVDVMISGFAGAGAAISNLAKEKQVVFWNFQWTDEIAKSSPFSFTYNQMPNEVAKVWLDTAYQKGHRKIAIINNETHAGGEYLINELKNKLQDYSNMEIVAIERVPLFGSDLRTTLLKMNSKRPDIYLSLLLNPTIDEFAKKMKEQDINTPISSINRFEHSKEKELFENNWGIGGSNYNQNIIEKYSKRYSGETMEEMAQYVYDVMDIIIQAYEKNNTKPDGKKLSDTLLQMKNYNGGLGTTRLDSDGIFYVPLIVGEIKNGQFVPIESETK